MFDIDGFVTSTPFLSQLAAIITAVISALLSGIIGQWFGTGV